jgi:hypothetical protein
MEAMGATIFEVIGFVASLAIAGLGLALMVHGVPMIRHAMQESSPRHRRIILVELAIIWGVGTPVVGWLLWRVISTIRTTVEGMMQSAG